MATILPGTRTLSPWPINLPELGDVSDPLIHWKSVSGYDVYIWEHIEDKRSVAFRDPVEMSCRRAEKQEVECRGRAPIEVQLA